MHAEHDGDFQCGEALGEARGQVILCIDDEANFRWGTKTDLWFCVLVNVSSLRLKDLGS